MIRSCHVKCSQVRHGLTGLIGTPASIVPFGEGGEGQRAQEESWKDSKSPIVRHTYLVPTPGIKGTKGTKEMGKTCGGLCARARMNIPEVTDQVDTSRNRP